MNNIYNYILLIFYLSICRANQSVKIIEYGMVVFYTIETDQDIITIGFEEQKDQLDQDFIVCQLFRCHCQNMLSINNKHPIQDKTQQTSYVECQDNKIKFYRLNNGLTPYVWHNPFKMSTLRQPTISTYQDSDLMSNLRVDDYFTLKWKFIDENQIDFAIIWKKKSWVGLGFGSNCIGNQVDLIIVELDDNNNVILNGITEHNFKLISTNVNDNQIMVRFQIATKLTHMKLDKNQEYIFSYAWGESSTINAIKHQGTKQFSIILGEMGMSQYSIIIIFITLLIFS